MVDSGLNWFYVFCNMLTLSGYRLYGRSVILCRSLYILFFFLCALETRIIEDPTAATAVQATLPVLQPSLNKNSQQNQIELYEERIRHSLLQPEKCLAWRTWSGPKMLLCLSLRLFDNPPKCQLA